MAKKKNQNNDNEKKDDDGAGCGKKQNATGVTVVVLKMDLHCEGCAGRVVKAVRTLDGVESVRIGDSELNKITVIGNLDPVKLRQKVEEKTKKKVELISPASKKEKDGDNNKTQSAGSGDNNKQQKQQPPPEKAKTAGKKNEKKPKESPVTTAVLKVPLHCQGCVRRIHKLVSKTKGFMEMSVDKNKDLVTVKGGIDMKLLAAALQQKLKRGVEIVPAKKDGGAGAGDGGDKKGKGGAGGGGEKKGKGGGGNDGGAGAGGGGEKKGKHGGGEAGEGNDGGAGAGKAEGYKMESYGRGPGEYPYPQIAYGPGYMVNYVHAPQLFSDENPNACTVM